MPVRGVVEQLELFASLEQHNELLQQTGTASTPRERFWSGPPEIRLSAGELAEATGYSLDWIYKRTSPRSAVPKLPVRRLGSQLVFVVGEVREYFLRYETLPPLLVGSAGSLPIRKAGKYVENKTGDSPK